MPVCREQANHVTRTRGVYCARQAHHVIRQEVDGESEGVLGDGRGVLVSAVPLNDVGRRKEARVLFIATVDSHVWYFHLPQMRLLRDMGYEVEVAAGPSGFAARIEAAGFHVIPFDFTKNPLDLHLLTITTQLIRLMRERRYVLVHVHTPIAGFIGRYAARRAGVPHIMYTAHGFHFHPLGNPVTNAAYWLVEKVGSRWTTVLVTINEHDERAARRWFSRAGLTIYRVSGVGVDTGLFTPPTAEYRGEARRALGVDPGAVVIGWVGELDRGKRPLDALRVLAMLRTKVPDAVLLMAGEGPMAGLVRQRASALGLDTAVLVTGRQDDMPHFLAACDVLLSTSGREGLPKSIMEAMAMGMPVVAWESRGCSDLILDGVTGYLVPFGDVQGMGEGLESLGKSAEDRHRLGSAGRDRVLTEFTTEHVLSQMRAIYEVVLGERSI